MRFVKDTSDITTRLQTYNDRETTVWDTEMAILSLERSQSYVNADMIKLDLNLLLFLN